MAVSPLFQTDFARAGSALEGLLGTYMDTNIAEGKAQYARELKAADPSGYLEIYKEELRALGNLQKELSSLRSKGTGGTTRSFRSTSPDLLAIEKLRNSRIERQRDASSEFKAGAQAFGEVERNVVDDMQKFGDASTPEQLSDIEGRLKRHIQTVSPKTVAEQHAFAEEFVKTAAQAGAGQPVMDKIAQVFGSLEYIATPEDLQIYRNPDELPADQEFRLNQLRNKPKGSSTVTVREGTAGLDPSQLAKTLMLEIAAQKVRVKQARNQYETALSDFKELSRGPNRNLAFSPISTRPSQRSAALDQYANLVRTDPTRARAVLEASREQGEFTIPDRLADIESDPDSPGMAPIDVVLDRVAALEALTGYTRGPAEPGRFGVDATPKSLTASDIPAVRQAMQDMLDAVDAPMYEGQRFGNIQSIDQNVELKNYLQNAVKALDEFEKKDPNTAAKAAESFSKELVDWKDSQSEQEIRSSRSDNQPGYAVSRSISRVQNAIRDASETGNQEKLGSVLADETNKIKSTDEFLQSAYGRQFLDDVSDLMKHQNIGYFEQNLVDLKRVSESGAANKIEGFTNE